jgi:hypothetical protein
MLPPDTQLLFLKPASPGKQQKSHLEGSDDWLKTRPNGQSDEQDTVAA